ncbi:hypothetical protein J4526_08355 [Desulfurococcaceae archaeon MEX13E-LK6-19]|nr:hypothetical protein J4526_08355 [Desulfurococcaceae archaeon MEX13E-LK6-19]
MSTKYWPLPYNGIPCILHMIGMALLVTALIIPVGRIGIPSEYNMVSFFLGIILILMSTGKRATVTNNSVILEYGYPIAIYRIVVREVVSVLDIPSLERGRLFKYFKLPVATLAIVMTYPIIYMIVKGVAPEKIYYIGFLLIPIVVCTGLLAHFLLTYSGYKQFVKRVGGLLGSLIVILSMFIASIYHSATGSFITMETRPLVIAIISELLLVIAFLAIVVLKLRRPIVVIEDSKGRYYAIGALSEECAKELINTITREVMGCS